MSRASDRIVRDVARVVVLDADDNVLLLHGFDPADPSAGRWWFTPGGGVEPGETFELDSTGWTEGERRSLLGARWWSLAELGGASERVFPDTLPELLRAAIGVLG